MLDAGLTQEAIAGAMGISRSYVSAILGDPDGVKERARKDRYAGKCEKCGGKTNGDNGPGTAAKICASCIQGLKPGEKRPRAASRRRAEPKEPAWKERGWPQVCSGCGAGVHETEEGRCAFCRMADRGDNQLLSHDSRGWLERIDWVAVRYGRSSTRVEVRIPCGCGCGMVETPQAIYEREQQDRLEQEREDEERWWHEAMHDPTSDAYYSDGAMERRKDGGLE